MTRTYHECLESGLQQERRVFLAHAAPQEAVVRCRAGRARLAALCVEKQTTGKTIRESALSLPCSSGERGRGGSQRIQDAQPDRRQQRGHMWLRCKTHLCGALWLLSTNQRVHGSHLARVRHHHARQAVRAVALCTEARHSKPPAPESATSTQFGSETGCTTAMEEQQRANNSCLESLAAHDDKPQRQQPSLNADEENRPLSAARRGSARR